MCVIFFVCEFIAWQTESHNRTTVECGNGIHKNCIEHSHTPIDQHNDRSLHISIQITIISIKHSTPEQTHIEDKSERRRTTRTNNSRASHKICNEKYKKQHKTRPVNTCVRSNARNSHTQQIVKVDDLNRRTAPSTHQPHTHVCNCIWRTTPHACTPVQNARTAHLGKASRRFILKL